MFIVGILNITDVLVPRGLTLNVNTERITGDFIL